MQTILFRSTVGAEDAPALIAVHEACHEADQILAHSVLEYKPSLDGYTNQLADSDSADWIIAEMDGEIAGYGHTLWDWPERDGNHCYLHNGWIAPNYRGRGIGRELLQHLEARCHEKAIRDGNTAHFDIGANASGTETDACRLLTHTGYRVLYTVLEMDFAVTQTIDPTPLPAGYALHPVLPEHYRAVWQCIGDAYYVHGGDNRGREIGTEGSYQRYFHSASADPDLWFAAWEESRIAGQCLCRIENGIGEVFEMSVGHPHRRKGLAKSLLQRGLRELQKREVPRIRLFTMLENPTPAWKLYESVGFQILKTFPRWRKAV